MDHLYPHGRCLLWNGMLLSWHVTCDSIIALSYLVISCVLYIFSRHIDTSQVISRWAFNSFATFILACACTHVMDIVVIWWPAYYFHGVVKTVCAAASLSTAVILFNLFRNFDAIEDKLKEHPVTVKDAP